MGLQIDSLAHLVGDGFARAAVTSGARLRDDQAIRTAARNIYDVLPAPANIAIKMGVGAEGVERFVFAFRDQLVASGVTDLYTLDVSDYRRFLTSSLATVPGFGALISMPGGVLAEGARPEPSTSAHIEPLAPMLDEPQRETELTLTDSAASEADDLGDVSLEIPRCWFLYRQGEQYGPWSDTDFLSLLKGGHLKLADKV